MNDTTIKRMTEADCLTAIAAGEEAWILLRAAMPSADRRFRHIDHQLIRFLADVRVHFPDAEYYTASGGFTLTLGRPHAENGGKSQQQLSALIGHASIGDGDY